jgi:beta-aspartyl-peptidase (threonine type)
MSDFQNNFTVLIHGGAGVIKKDAGGGVEHMNALTRIITQIHTFCKTNNNEIQAIDVVEYGVKLLEDEPLFNAGKGAVYTCQGTHELEASIMDGKDLSCGATSLVNTIKNPISLARIVMEHTPHVYVIGSSAIELAEQYGLEKVESSYYSTLTRYQHLLDAQAAQGIFNDHDDLNNKSKGLPTGTGTVGCVCMFQGHVAAATSTGGMTNKMCGRIGDTPIIGAGTYANDNTCAISATGKGELFMKHVVGHDISARMEYTQCSLHDSVRATVFSKLPSDSGGVIAVNRLGEFSMEFNTPGMFRAVCTENGLCQVGIWEDVKMISLP